MDFEQVAHELAILYMQLEIKEGKLQSGNDEDLETFANEYKYLFGKFFEITEA